MSDHDEIRRLLEQNGWIRSLAQSLVADENDADDVLQDVWIVALIRPPRTSNLKRWARSVTQRVIWRNWRGATRRSRREAAVARSKETESPSTEEIVERTQVQQQLVEAVLKLPEPYGESILLCFFEGLTAGEIAIRLGVPVETVRTRIKRGLRHLRSTMDATYRGDRAAWSIPLLMARSGAKNVGILSWIVGKGVPLKIAVVLGIAAAVGLGGWLIRDREPRPPMGEHKPTVASGTVERQTRGPSVARAGSDWLPLRRSPPPVRSTAPPRRVSVRPGIHGTIRDSVGICVANATVAILAPKRRWRPEDPTRNALSVIAKAKSGEDGSFRFDGVTGPMLLVIAAEGFGRIQRLIRAGHAVDVVLREPGHVVGRVTQGDEPVANALVVLFQDDSITQLHGFGPRGIPLSRQLEVSYAHQRTNSDGTFRFSAVAEGTYFVSASPPNRLGQRLRRKLEVVPGTRSFADIQIQACDLFCLRGCVLDSESRKPISGARIRFDRNPDQGAVSGDDGYYALEGVAGRRIRTLVDADGYLPETCVETGPNAADVLLSRPGTVTGRVVTREGSPVPGARVRSFKGSRVVRTHAGGGFTLRDVHPGSACRLFVQADGFCPAITSPLAVRSGKATGGVTVQLGHGGTVVGSITGLPPGLESVRHPIALRPRGDSADRAIHDVMAFCTTTDEHARFRLAHVAPGEYCATAWLGQTFSSLQGTIELREGEETEVRLTYPGNTAIRGCVVSEEGRPVPFARVAVDRPGEASALAITDGAGRFVLLTDCGPLCPLFVHSYGRYFDRRTHGQRNHDNLIRLARRWPVAGFVTDATGAPAHSFWIRVFAHDVAHAEVGGRRFFETPDGAFKLAERPRPSGPSLLPEGVFDIEAGGPANQVSAIATNVVYGPNCAPPVLTFRLRAGGSLACRVQDEGGRPSAGAIVGIRLTGTAKRLERRTDRVGRVTFDCLQAGLYEVEAGSKQGNAVETVHVTSGRASAVQLTLVPGGVLVLVTKSVGGRPLADATVTAAPRDGKAWRTRVGRTGCDGMATFPGLFPGWYLVTAVHPEGVGNATVWLAKTERRAVTLKLDRVKTR